MPSREEKLDEEASEVPNSPKIWVDFTPLIKLLKKLIWKEKEYPPVKKPEDYTD